jgi:H/ACA ribonucleoprotein complex subunit 4
MDIEKIKQNKSLKDLLEFGIINIDKPSGPTSFTVSDFVRKTLGLRKTSHFGTLDPKVTGVLPIALNRGCKLTGFFLGEDKEYAGIMRFHEEISLPKVRKAIKEKFLGNITQLPPVKSRVKRQERQREIKSFKILEKNGKDFLFIVSCQGGTYIRKLVHDLGEYLDTGAHMLELRRIRAGIFKEKDSITLYELEEAVKDENKLKEIIIPGEIVTELFPVVQVKEDSIKRLFTGKPVYLSDLKKPVKIKEGEKVCIFSGDKFIMVAKTVKDTYVFAKSEFTLQPMNT